MIIVQDNTGTVDGANSYVSDADLQAYATLRGISLPESTVPLLIKAMDYLASKYWSADPVNDTQNTEFPRGSYGIPTAIKNAQLALAVKAIDLDLLPVTEGGSGQIVRESIDGLHDLTFSQSKDSPSEHTFPDIERLIAPYLATSGLGMFVLNR